MFRVLRLELWILIKTDSAILPKLSLAYDLAEGTSVGFLINRGYNHGGNNVSFANRAYYSV